MARKPRTAAPAASDTKPEPEPTTAPEPTAAPEPEPPQPTAAPANGQPAEPPRTAEAKALAEIIEKNREVRTLREDYEAKADRAKLAKKRLEAAQDELSNLIAKTAREDDKPRPLLDKIEQAQANGQAKAEPAPAATKPEPKPERWRSAPITAIGVYGIPDGILNALTEAGITTIGAMADYTAADKPLTDIPTIGAAKAEKIENAMLKYWEDNPRDEPDDGAEWESTKLAEADAAADAAKAPEATADAAPEADAEDSPEADPWPAERIIPAGHIACNRCNAIRPAQSHPCPDCGNPEYRRSQLDTDAEKLDIAATKKPRRKKAAD